MSALKVKGNGSARKIEASADAVLNEFTNASRSIQMIGGSHPARSGEISAQQEYHNERVSELKNYLREVGMKGDLRIKDRIALENDTQREVSEMRSMSPGKLRESLYTLIGKVKGPNYEKALGRVRVLAGELHELANADSKSSSHVLETAINDFSRPAGKQESSGQDQERKLNPQIAKDLRLLKKVAIVESIAKDIIDHVRKVDALDEHVPVDKGSVYYGAVTGEKAEDRGTHAESAQEKGVGAQRPAPKNTQAESGEKESGSILPTAVLKQASAKPESTPAAAGEKETSGSVLPTSVIKEANEQHTAAEQHTSGDGKEKTETATGAGAGSTTKNHGKEEPVVIGTEGNSIENMEVQQERIKANIQKRMQEIESNAAKMSKMSRNEILSGRLHEKISDANVKLFVEINAYKDMLMEMKDRIDTMFPKNGSEDEKRQHKEHHEKIDEIVNGIGDAGASMNKRMTKLANDKGLGVRRVPMFTDQIRNIQTDMYGIRDDSGNSLYRMLGANVLAFEEGKTNAEMERQMDAYYKEIMDKLSKNNKNVLNDYEDKYTDISELVVAQLAAIGVQFGEQEGKGKHKAGIWRTEHMPLVFRKDDAA